MDQPRKLSDKKLYHLLNSKISKGEYVFKKHARQRLKDRNITDLEALNILEGRTGYRRHRNKSKDSYDDDKKNWKYCIEGINSDVKKMRLIISFEDGVIPIITVMWIN